jgi:sugar lactone lactonase YvrE
MLTEVCRMRLNDGAIDSAGRFWAGAMNDPLVKEPTNEGVLFRLDPDLKLHRIMGDLTIPNGIGWNVKNDTMFFTDSVTKNIYKFHYDPVTGDIADRQVFFHLDEEGAVPDGFAIDVEDHLWTAAYGGWKVLRISPAGNVVGEISLPTRCITCPSFTGEELFIASAEEEAPEQYPESTKLAGSLFRVNVGVQGLPVNKFRLSQGVKLPKAGASSRPP